MHILYIHQYFSTPNGAATTAAFDFVRRWVRAGHRVTVVTTVARLVSQDAGAAIDSRRVHRFRIDGVEVTAWRIAYRQSMGFLRRVWAFLLFAAVGTWYAVWLPGVDVIYASSSPLTVGIAGLVARWFRRRPFVFEVRDVWPEVPIRMGVLRNRFLIGLARFLERTIYRYAAAIVAVSPGMVELVRQVAPLNKRVVLVPNNSDASEFHPDVDGGAVRGRRGWNDKVVCVHTGSMGKVNGLDVLVRAAERFRDRPEVLFALIGEGSEKAFLIAEARRRGLSNLQVCDGVPKREMPATLAAADVCLMTVTPAPILEHNSANKFFDYLCAGRPVVLNYGGWQRAVLEECSAGLGSRMGDDEEFFSHLTALVGDAGRRRDMGGNARRLAVERFSCDRLASEALAVLESVARVPEPQEPTGGGPRPR